MVIYYKATRPNGTDFYTGTVDYAGALASGEPLPLLTNESEVYKCCTGTVYHASDVPSETLVGCAWPCRLFEVEGEPVAQVRRKFGFRTMRVIREIEGWRALGPNGREVAALIDRAARLTPEEGGALYSAWYATWGASRDAAWDAAGDAAGDAVGEAAGAAAWDAARDAVGDAVGGAAGAAAWDAVLALAVRDLISEDHFNLLYGPWKEVVGE